jgi:phenylacetate-coenzyme A ligase PaaK-like adenylate-forming protein
MMDFNLKNFIRKIFDSKIMNFDELALQLFSYQNLYNEVFRKYISGVALKTEINNINDIPFLPVSFFKTHELKTGNFESHIIFTSSGTSGSVHSKHEVNDVSIYASSFNKAFQLFYGDANEYCILALLPSYLEREGSSLVYMFESLINESKHPFSDFYLHDLQKLKKTLLTLKEQKQKTILAGVTFALLDFSENFQIDFPELIVMETGGMKGRRKEMIREELHELLKKTFGVLTIHSEYGMTELLSQAYSKGEGKFVCPPWMKIIITDINDPFHILPDGKTGIINVIDLANIYSCAFIKTEDIGLKFSDGTFEVLGRVDNSDLRGCSLMYL